MARITIAGDRSQLPGAASGSLAWGPAFAFTAPVDGDFAWINQGGASVSDMGGSLALDAPTSASTNCRIRKKAAPSTPYTIEMAFLTPAILQNFYNVGFCWRQSSDGKLATFEIGMNSSNTQIVASKWNSATSYNAAYLSPNIAAGFHVFWFKATDDGANRTLSWAPDGQTWKQIHSVTRTDFLTADEVGFFIAVTNSTYNMIMSLLHWKQS